VALAIVVVLGACGSSGTAKSGSSPPAAAQSLIARDVAAAAGVARATHTHGENCVDDIDGDGKTDLILSTHDSTSAPPAWPLMLGVGDGRFRLDSRFTLPVRDRHGCAVADFNGDGLLDIYLSIGGCQGQKACQGQKELWIQQNDHTFVDEAAKWGISDPGARGRVPVVVDANGDDRPDLFTSAEQGVDVPSLNRLWINRGDHFELQQGPITNDKASFCAAAADIDGDGRDEIALCTQKHGFILYRNVRGKYVEDTKSFDVDPYGRITAEFPDLNGDGRPDLVTVTRDVVQVYLNQKGRYPDTTWSTEVADGADVAFGDIDGDGDLDMYVQQRGHDDEMFVNTRGGTEFVPGPKLPTKHGVGDTVVAIPDWKGTGRAAFLVNNGLQYDLGRRQLIQFTRR
jgi:hypothetical protein